MWVFGYGSLVWKVDFKYETKIVGYIKGYLRRFYQHSIDHRGVPGKDTKNVIHIIGNWKDIFYICTENVRHLKLIIEPGRVVTLVPSDDPNAAVWGVAYKIRTEDIEQVTNHLDFREKNGYSKKTVTFHPKDNSMETFVLTLYVATQENESFAGPASIEDIAKQVVSCEGPSGSNKEYVYKLAQAMRELVPNIEDNHLFSLEAAVRKLDADRKK